MIAARIRPSRSVTFELGSTVAVCLTITLAAATGIWQVAGWKSSNDLTLTEIQASLKSHQDEMKNLWTKKEGDHGVINARLTKLESEMEHMAERVTRGEGGSRDHQERQGK
jgi:hypothetical protein